MSFKGEDLGIFSQLGLTTRQAEVYLTICRVDQTTVKTCAKRLQIARSEIYRVTPSLEKLGLIKRVINTPTIFRAVPIAEGLSILLQRNAEKHKKIQAKANEFVKNFKETNIEESMQEEHQCALIFERANKRREFVKMMNKLQTSLDAIVSWMIFKQDVLRYTTMYKKAIERGVKFRHITHIPKGERIPEGFNILKADSFEVKYTSTPPPTSVAIIDQKETALITSQIGCMLETILWSNNPRLAAIYQDYFELKWQSATSPYLQKKNHQTRKHGF